MSNTKQSTAVQPTSFTSLPGEIRNKIYRNLLLLTTEDHDAINVSLKPTNPNPSSPPPAYSSLPSISLSIFRTNAQIHNEASSLFYGSNRFLTHVKPTPSNPADENSYLLHHIIPPHYRDHLTKIDVVVSSSPHTANADAEQSLLTARNVALAAALVTLPRIAELRVFVNDCNVACTWNRQFEPAALSVWPLGELRNIVNDGGDEGGIRYFDLADCPIAVDDGGDGVLLERYRCKVRPPRGYARLSREERYAERGRMFEEVVGRVLRPVEDGCRGYRVAAWRELAVGGGGGGRGGDDMHRVAYSSYLRRSC
ncbi:MAG: hypothetical protein M1835_007441 [Candelina submexicana]|nr:MAG: hypothetical protein M1835_007441 [Candelina submexicana]